jgi:cytochrome c-type biogenesis protein CcmH/NrfF
VSKRVKTGEWSLWAAVLTLFALLIGAWVVLFAIARRNPVETVPLEHRRAADPKS